jgi:hypothetical protein
MIVVQARAKLVKELSRKQEANDAVVARGVAGKFQGIRIGQQLDYTQTMAALRKFG